jgi:hypothetical protein
MAAVEMEIFLLDRVFAELISLRSELQLFILSFTEETLARSSRN